MNKALRGQITIHAAVHEVPNALGENSTVALLFIPPRETMLPAPTDGNYSVEEWDKRKEKTVFREGDMLIRKADTSTKAITERDYIRRPYDPDMDYLRFSDPCAIHTPFLNPYNIAVVAREEMFKGRKEECAQLLSWVSSGNHVTVYGLQRVGKTSLVHRVFRDDLQRSPLRDKIRFATIELQELGSDYIKQRQFLGKLIEAIIEALRGSADEREIQNAFATYMEDTRYEVGDKMSLFARFRRALEAIANHMDQNVVLFLDEFSELCRSIERNDHLISKNPKYSPDKLHPHEMYIDVPFMKQFSSLLKSAALHRKITFIFAARPFVAQYDSDKEMQVLKLTKSLTLYYLREEAALSLIIDPIQDVIGIDSETTDYLYRLTAEHPYLIQFFMQDLVDAAIMKGRQIIRLQDVRGLETDLTTKGAPYAAQFDVLESDYSVEEVMNPMTRDLGRGTLALISKIGTMRPQGWVEEIEIKRGLAKNGVFGRASADILSRLGAAEIIHTADRNGKLCLRVSVPLLRKRYVAQNMYQKYFPDQPRH